MKFTVTFKDPDYSIDELTPENTVKIKKACSKFFEYDEYVRIEIDTETKTAKVLEA